MDRLKRESQQKVGGKSANAQLKGGERYPDIRHKTRVIAKQARPTDRQFDARTTAVHCTGLKLRNVDVTYANLLMTLFLGQHPAIFNYVMKFGLAAKSLILNSCNLTSRETAFHFPSVFCKSAISLFFCCRWKIKSTEIEFSFWLRSATGYAKLVIIKILTVKDYNLSTSFAAVIIDTRQEV